MKTFRQFLESRDDMMSPIEMDFQDLNAGRKPRNHSVYDIPRSNGNKARKVGDSQVKRSPYRVPASKPRPIR